MSNDFLLIGPLPPPVNGCSLANQVLLSGLSESLNVDSINTSTVTTSAKQGKKFSLSKSVSFLSTYRYLYKVLYSEVIYFTPGQTFFGVLKYFPFALLAVILRKPYIVHLHGGHLGESYRRLSAIKKVIFRFFFSKASAAIALSESLRSNFSELVDESKVYVVENFADDDVFLPANFKKQNSKLRILFLSNILRSKGIIVLLDALIMLREKNIDFECKVAGIIDDEVKNDFIRKLKELGDHTNYIGPAYGEDKKNLLLWANVFSLPTYYEMEGQPISIIEAMASGNIIISTNHAGIPDIINQSNGYLTEKNNSKQLFLTLEKISLEIEDQVNKFSKANFEHSSKNFKKNNFIRKIKTIFHKVSKNKI